ncbi:MAG: hypothetical protein J0I08_22970 [Rhizobiales bacterium]|nr:hypothetical protein [Hyphomicrobiales bacterium]
MIKLRLHDCLQGAAFILQTDLTPRHDALVALAQVGAKSFVFGYRKAFNSLGVAPAKARPLQKGMFVIQ